MQNNCGQIRRLWDSHSQWKGEEEKSERERARERVKDKIWRGSVREREKE